MQRMQKQILIYGLKTCDLQKTIYTFTFFDDNLALQSLNQFLLQINNNLSHLNIVKIDNQFFDECENNFMRTRESWMLFISKQGGMLQISMKLRRILIIFQSTIISVALLLKEMQLNVLNGQLRCQNQVKVFICHLLTHQVHVTMQLSIV